METISPQATEDRLNRALRICASQASSLTGGGAALLYTRQPGDSLSGRLEPPQVFARQTRRGNPPPPSKLW